MISTTRNIVAVRSSRFDKYDIFLESFVSYLKEVFEAESYAFEICATDFWCLQFNIEYERIFITRSQADYGVDAIVIPKLNENYRQRNYYLIQITMGNKSNQNLKNFLTMDPKLRYGKIIPEDAICNRVILALGNVSQIEDKSVKIIAGNNLANMILEIGNRYGLVKNGQLSEDYLGNVAERVGLWEDIHNSIGQAPVFEQYARFFAVNHMLLKKTCFHLPKDFADIITHRETQILIATTNTERERFLVKYKLKIENLGLKYDDSKEKLALLVGSLLGYSQKEYFITPTIRYLSVKIPGTNTALAHFDWSYNSRKANQALFGFKCSYERAKGLNTRIKPIYDVKNHLKFKMNSFLIEPSLIDGKLIKELILLSREQMLHRS